MRSLFLLATLVLATALAAPAQAGPSVSVDCGPRPEHELRVDSDGHDHNVGPVTVSDGPGYYSQCPIQAAGASGTSSASSACTGTPVAYTAIWTVYLHTGPCLGVVLTDEKNPATFRCPSAEDAPCTISVVVSPF